MFIFAFGRWFRSDYGLRMNISLFWPTSLTSFVCLSVFSSFLRLSLHFGVQWIQKMRVQLNKIPGNNEFAQAKETMTVVCIREVFVSNWNYLTDIDTRMKHIFIFFFHKKRILFLLLLLSWIIVVATFIWPIHKSVSVSFPLPFSGRLWFITRKCIHIKMLLKNLLCCKLISFMSLYMSLLAWLIEWTARACSHRLIFFFIRPFVFGRDCCWLVAYCLLVGFITPFVSYAAVFKWFVISCWYLLFKFLPPLFLLYLFLSFSLVYFFLPVKKKIPIKIGIPCVSIPQRQKNEIPINIHHHDFDPFFNQFSLQKPSVITSTICTERRRMDASVMR